MFLFIWISTEHYNWQIFRESTTAIQPKTLQTGSLLNHLTILSMTADSQKNGSHLVSTTKMEPSLQSPVKVFTNSKMEEANGAQFSSIPTTPNVKSTQATGTELKNTASWPESTCFLMPRIPEYLPKELHRLTVSAFTLILKSDTISLLTTCPNKNCQSSTLSKLTESSTWLFPQNTWKSALQLKQPAFFMKFKLTLAALWTKSSWRELWWSQKKREKTSFLLIWLCARPRHLNPAPTSVRSLFLNMSSQSSSVTFASTHYSSETKLSRQWFRFVKTVTMSWEITEFLT